MSKNEYLHQWLTFVIFSDWNATFFNNLKNSRHSKASLKKNEEQN